VIKESRSRPLFDIRPGRQIRSFRKISDVAERAKRRRQMLEVAEADLELEAGFCPCERRARRAGNRSPNLVGRARRTELPP
jgi:hypothetical protein